MAVSFGLFVDLVRLSEFLTFSVEYFSRIYDHHLLFLKFKTKENFNSGNTFLPYILSAWLEALIIEAVFLFLLSLRVRLIVFVCAL